MTGWLQKILNPPAKVQKPNKLPVQRSSGNLPTSALNCPSEVPQSLPNATIIYGIGASLMFVASFFLLIQGRWFTGFLVFFLGGCLTGFALHLLKHQD